MGPGHFFNRVDSALETIEETIVQTEWTLVQRRSIHVAVKAGSRVLFMFPHFSQEKRGYGRLLAVEHFSFFAHFFS